VIGLIVGGNLIRSKITIFYNFTIKIKMSMVLIKQPGREEIETNEGNFNIQPGDFVVFKDGLDGIRDVRKPVKKHYFFP